MQRGSNQIRRGSFSSGRIPASGDFSHVFQQIPGIYNSNNAARYNSRPQLNQQFPGFDDGRNSQSSSVLPSNVNQWNTKDSVDPETRRKMENAKQLAHDQINRLQSVVTKKYAFNDANLADIYLQWRLASSVVASLGISNAPADRAIQMDFIGQYIRVFTMLVKIPFYTKTLTVENLRNLVLKTYYVSAEWLKALFSVVNAANQRILRESICDMNEHGDNLLHVFVREGLYDYSLLEILSAICGLNSINKKGENALKIAMLRDENSKKKFTTQLLEHGADINISINSQTNNSDAGDAEPVQMSQAETPSEPSEPTV